jgi:diacylglycerol kinase family enzyme
MSRYSKGKQPRNGIYLEARNVSIESSNEMWIQIDNEYILDNNISLTLINHAVQIIALGDLSYPLGSIPAI